MGKKICFTLRDGEEAMMEMEVDDIYHVVKDKNINIRRSGIMYMMRETFVEHLERSSFDTPIRESVPAAVMCKIIMANKDKFPEDTHNICDILKR